MDLVEKYLGGDRILKKEKEKLSNAAIMKIVDFMDARKAGKMDIASKLEKELMKEIGSDFYEVLLMHGDPEKLRYATVRNKWLSMVKTKKFKSYGFEGPMATSKKQKSYGYTGPAN